MALKLPVRIEDEGFGRMVLMDSDGKGVAFNMTIKTVEEIKTAVNAHAALVQALENIADLWKHGVLGGKDFEEYEAAIEALKLAEGKP